MAQARAEQWRLGLVGGEDAARMGSKTWHGSGQDNRSGHFQAQSVHGFWIQRRLAIFLDCHPEAVGVVPHGPPKVVVFKREPGVPDPCVTVLRLGVPKNAEFVAYYRDSVLLRPIRDLVDLGLDVRGVPVLSAQDAKSHAGNCHAVSQQIRRRMTRGHSEDQGVCGPTRPCFEVPCTTIERQGQTDGSESESKRS